MCCMTQHWGQKEREEAVDTTGCMHTTITAPGRQMDVKSVCTSLSENNLILSLNEVVCSAGFDSHI